MTFTLKAAFLAGGLALGCAAGPDEVELGYGHLFAGDSSLEGWQIANDDSDMVTVGLVWKLRPTQVEVVNPVYPPVGWTLESEAFPAPEPVNPVYPPQDVGDERAEAALEEIAQEAGEIADTLEAFDAFGIVTKIGFFVLGAIVLWTQRERLGRLIPGGNWKKKD